jgi:hypothetical protein
VSSPPVLPPPTPSPVHLLQTNRKSAMVSFSADYAAYGVTTGKLSQRKLGDLSCVVVSRGWPGWFWAAHARGIYVRVLIMGDLQRKPLVKTMSPSTEVFGWDQIFSVYDLSGK